MIDGSHQLRRLLLDLLAWCEKAERAAGRTTRSAIMNDEQAELALSRAVEIVGEVAGRLIARYPDWCERHDRDELTGAYRMRNRLAYGYDTISPDILYDIAVRDLRRPREKAHAWVVELDDLP